MGEVGVKRSEIVSTSFMDALCREGFCSVALQIHDSCHEHVE